MLNKILYRPTDIAPLIFFRIVFGVLGFLDVVGVWAHYHIRKDTFNPDNLQIKYYGFEWVQAFPDPWMSLIFWTIALAGLGVAAGKWYRFSATLFALGFSYIFFLEKCNYLNHGYLFCVLSYLMIFLPADRAFALDLKTSPQRYRKYIARWPIFLLKFLMAVVYIYGGIAKINPDWLQGFPLRVWLPFKKDYFLIGPLLEQDWVAWFMSYGGLFHDLFIIPFMLFKRTRVMAFILCCGFHLTNTAVFQIGIFPWLSMALTALFFPTDFPRKAVDYLRSKLHLIEKWHSKYQGFLANLNINATEQLPVKRNALISLFVISIIVVNLLLPLRHHAYDSNVSWTEEGHRYAWRMMLRGKTGVGYFHVKDLSSDKEIKKLYAKDFLSKRQDRKYKTHPDMILFVAHHVRDMYKEKWDTDSVAVYPNFRARLNGRNYQTYTDNTVDLAKEEWHWIRPYSWILPLKEDNFPDKYSSKNSK